MTDRAYWFRLLAVCAAVLGLPLASNDPYVLSVAIQVCMFSVAAIGAWLLLAGGLWSFGQGAFALVGSYVATLLVMRGDWSFWVALPAGVVVGGITAALVAVPLLRTSGVTFAILTMVGLLAIDQIVALLPDLTGGRGGIIGVPPPDALSIGDFQVTFTQPLSQYYVIAGLLVITLAIAVALVRTPWFTTLGAVRQRPLLARSLGIVPRRYLITVFIVAGATTAAAGAFSAAYLGVAHPKVWYVYPSIFIVAYAIVGGVRSAYGPLLGATALIVATEWLRATDSLQLILVAAGMIATTLLLPDGIAGIGNQLGRLLRSLNLSRGSGTDPPVRSTIDEVGKEEELQ